MAVEEPFELLQGLVTGERALREVAPDLGIAVEREEALEVVALEMPQDEPICLEDICIA